MYSLRNPQPLAVEAYRISQKVRAVHQSTAEIPDPPPPGFRPNRGGDVVGTGVTVFQAAVEAVRHWEMFPDWARVVTGGEPVQLGQTAAIVARCCGVWGVNCCRVVDVTVTARSFAFTYATTDDHAMRGAEQFRVEWRADDSVWFGVHSVSRPRDRIVWLVLPWLRRLQRRFISEAPLMVRRAVQRRLATQSLAASNARSSP